MISTIINNATIVDGTGRPAFSTDVALASDRIARIGSCAEIACRSQIDGRGSILTAGFIDACSHTNDSWLSLPSWTSSLAQGITSEITGTCGRGGFDPELREREPAVTRRSFASPPQPIREACEAGAAGVSLDLSRTTPPEALVFARAAREGGAPLVAAHLRDYGHDFHDALEEALALAAAADVRLHLSHLQARRGAPPGAMEHALERIDRARAGGLDVSCDVFPYVAVWIELASLLPASVKRQALGDETLAAAVALEMQARLGDIWHDVMLAEVSGEERLPWCGMRFDEIGRQMRLRPARAAIEFIRHDGERARAFYFALRESDVATALSAGFCAIGTSAAACSFHAQPFGLVHPRSFGTTARVIGRFVRQRRTLTLEEAVRRMTSLPARLFGLDGYGELTEGARADLVLFDERGFIDTATYERPISAPAGLKHVWVAGRLKGT